MSTTEPRLPDETARPEPSARAAEKKEEEDGVAGGEGRRRRMRRPRVAINSIELLDIDDDDDGGGPDSCAPGQDSAPTAAALAQFVPSCVEDFSRKWLLYVMQQYYAKSYGTTISEIGEFSAQRLCTSNKNKGTKRDRRALENHSGEGNDKDMEAREVTTPESQHILSQAYKVMVDVPDPPKEELADDAGKKVTPPPPELTSQLSKASETTDDGDESGSGSAAGYEEDDEDDDEDDDDDFDDDLEKGAVALIERVRKISEGDEPDPFQKDSKRGKGRRGRNNSFRTEEEERIMSKVHHLFVKVPPKRTAKFERMVRRNRTLEHEVKVYSELLIDLQAFVKARVGDAVKLNIPKLYHGGGGEDEQVLVIEDLTAKGFSTRDWFKDKLSHEEVILSVKELAKFHACGLAYRMSLKEEIDEKYPYLESDLYTSNMAKELLAKYLDSFLHFLSTLPGIQEHVLKLRKISNEVFQLLVKLRRPSDPLGTRFNTICHGDMWMGNLMFKDDVSECVIIDFHSAQFLSPATDLAHLLLTSTSRAYRQEKWDEVVEIYYDTFNRTLAEFGLILRHLGTTYQDFLYEVKRALRGQFLCVAFIIPIVIYCGPMEWRFERRRGSSVDRKNTVRHLIQMMAITESEKEDQETHSDDEDGIPPEFADLYKDKELTQTLIDLIHTAADLDILDFEDFCKHLDTPKPMWSKTKGTTGKHIPVY